VKQLDAIDKILPFVIKDDAVRAVFLKGSIARDEIDEYSDVDFYCMVKNEKMNDFLKRRVDYIEQYKPLIFCEDVNFVGPQIVGVFDNGLHFDLYTVTYDSLQRTDEIKLFMILKAYFLNMHRKNCL
jgi:predicted nucleotidyltransferase